MSMHSLLIHLKAALEAPNETMLAQLKQDGWFAPLWMAGSSTTFPNGQVAIEFHATEVEGGERPVLFVYVDESQVRLHNPELPVMSYPLRLNPDDQELVSALDQQAPIYESRANTGRWSRLTRRLRPPRLVVLNVEVGKDAQSA